MFKTCYTCKESKPIAEYYHHKMFKDGRRNDCRDCYRIRRGPETKRKRGKRNHDPEKEKVRRKIRQLVREGKITKSDKCQSCGEILEKRLIHAHHAYGYDNGLAIMWLCFRCHAAEHRRPIY